MRLRLALMMIGALLVVATYTFPLWQSAVLGTPEEVTILFPGLPMDMQSAFANLPPDQQRAYLEIASREPQLAVRMVSTALQPRIPIPEEDQEMPEMNAPTPIAAGAFAVIDAVRWGQGRATFFQDVDNRLLLRFEDFSMPNGPDLRVFLSAVEAPISAEAARAGDTDPFEVGPLLSSVGVQNYELPEGFNLSPYRSVVIVSGELNLVYTYAALSVRQ
ncbi:MAG: DM13 domain-containing protein [Anaerolineae bacterium]|nr:DM13 domain-containing protein [Anaerolineae bacterium]